METKPQQEGRHGVRVAYVEDDPMQCRLAASYLKKTECEVELFTSAGDCLKRLKTEPFDIVITDLNMPEMDGLELLKEIKQISPSTEVIIVTGEADKEAAIQALKLGAYDFFEKPVLRDELVESVKHTIRYQTVLRQRDRYADQLAMVSKREAKKWGIEAFIGRSGEIKKVLEQIRRLQKAGKTNVLILGESGTGKELVARAIHFGSERSAGPFVAVNCSAIPSDLAESILFGHVRGSFTGATSDRKGQFELADGGTIFLDEIGDMPPQVQAKLLRVLEDGIVMPVGKATGRHVNTRVISATNVDIKERLGSNKFRSDLFYRLAGYTISLAPLRQRIEDLPLLVRHFVGMLSLEMGIPVPDISPEYISALEGYDYPGNVRELKNIIEHSLIEMTGKELVPGNLRIIEQVVRAGNVPGAEGPGSGEYDLKQADVTLVKQAIEKAGGNVAKAARLLGISRAKVYRLIN